MSEIQVRDGSVVQDTITDKTQPCAISEIYTWKRILKNYQSNLIQEVNERLDGDEEIPEDCEMNQYLNFLRNLKVKGEALGAIQREATSFRGDEYFSNNNLGSAVDVLPASNNEKKIVNDGVADRLSDRDKRVLLPFDELVVPVTPEQEEMPLVAMSNDRNAATHNFEEAKEMWDQFLNHLNLQVTSEPTTDNDDDGGSNDEPTADSDQDDFFLSDVDKVGPATSENLQEYIVENRVSIDWREHVDAEEWHEAPTVVTEEEAQERLQAVASEMPTGAFGVASNQISNGQISEAIMLIEDYE